MKGRYVVDKNGNRVAVILSIKEYEKMLEDIEELDCIRAYDAAMAEGGEDIPLDQVVAEIEQERKQKRKRSRVGTGQIARDGEAEPVQQLTSSR